MQKNYYNRVSLYKQTPKKGKQSYHITRGEFLICRVVRLSGNAANLSNPSILMRRYMKFSNSIFLLPIPATYKDRVFIIFCLNGVQQKDIPHSSWGVETLKNRFIMKSKWESNWRKGTISESESSVG